MEETIVIKKFFLVCMVYTVVVSNQNCRVFMHTNASEDFRLLFSVWLPRMSSCFSK